MLFGDHAIANDILIYSVYVSHGTVVGSRWTVAVVEAWYEVDELTS